MIQNSRAVTIYHQVIFFHHFALLAVRNTVLIFNDFFFPWYCFFFLHIVDAGNCWFPSLFCDTLWYTFNLSSETSSVFNNSSQASNNPLYSLPLGHILKRHTKSEHKPAAEALSVPFGVDTLSQLTCRLCSCLHILWWCQATLWYCWLLYSILRPHVLFLIRPPVIPSC